MSDSPYKKVRTGPHTTEYAHRLEYEKKNGPIPKGKVIHHKNDDTYNNKSSNLQAVSISKNKIESDKSHKKGKK